LFEKVKCWARSLKQDVSALYIAAHDSRTPWIARVVALAVTLYALSPIDLIPDFIPVIGYLDDLIIVPLGIWLVIRLIPPDLMQIYREAASGGTRLPVSWTGALLVGLVWLGLIVWLYRLLT
jgi:uncharacterized membrane protein YkvA (DUF1232 family)